MSGIQAAPHYPRAPSQPAQPPAGSAAPQKPTPDQIRQAVSGPLTQPQQREAAANQLLLSAEALGDDDFYSLTLTLAHNAGGPQMEPQTCAGLVTQAMNLQASGQITSERLDQFLSALTQGMGGPEMPPPLSEAVVEAVARHVMQNLVVALALVFVLGMSLGTSEAAEPSVTAATDAIQREFAWAQQAEQDELVESFQNGQRASLPDTADRTQVPPLLQKDTKHTPQARAASQATPSSGASAQADNEITQAVPADLPEDDIEDVVLERDSPELRKKLEREKAEAERAEAEQALQFGRRSLLDDLVDAGPKGPGQGA